MLEAAGPQEPDPATGRDLSIRGATSAVGHLARFITTIHFYWTTSFPSDTFMLARRPLPVKYFVLNRFRRK